MRETSVGAVDGLAVDLGDDVAGVRGRALSAGPPGVTVVTSAPAGALGSVGSEVSTPRYGRAIVSPCSRRGTTSRTVFDGTAKPMPTLPCELPAVAICELTPITRPVSSSSGPPELPGLIGASVWMTSSIEKPLGAWIERPMPETMPSVAVRSRPNGLPMAIAVSPTCDLARVGELQRLGVARGAAGVDLHDGEVARRVGALDLAVDAAPVGAELDHDAVGVADDVRVGHERAVAVDEEAGARARRRCGSRRRPGWPGRRSCPARDWPLSGATGLPETAGSGCDACGRRAAARRRRRRRPRSAAATSATAAAVLSRMVRGGAPAGSPAAARSRSAAASACAPARRLLLRSLACLLGLQAPLARPQMPGKLHRHGE